MRAACAVHPAGDSAAAVAAAPGVTPAAAAVQHRIQFYSKGVVMDRLPMLSAPPCRRHGIILKVFARHQRQAASFAATTLTLAPTQLSTSRRSALCVHVTSHATSHRYHRTMRSQRRPAAVLRTLSAAASVKLLWYVCHLTAGGRCAPGRLIDGAAAQAQRRGAT